MASIRWTLASASLCLGFAACAVDGTSEGGDQVTVDSASQVQALEVDEDGSDEDANDAIEEAPAADRDCSLSAVRKRVLATYDADHDGELSASERAALQEDFGEGAGRVRRLMRHERRVYLHKLYDNDGSGQLEADERAELEADLEVRCENRKHQVLAKFDANADGKLDDGEWKAFAADLAARFQTRREKLLAEFDTNHDARLELNEKRAALEALRQRFEERRAALERRFDTDGNGKLNAGEQAALVDYLRSRVRGEQFGG